MKKNINFMIIAISVFLVMFIASCNISDITIQNKHKAESEWIYESINIGDTLSKGFIDKIDIYGNMIGDTKSGKVFAYLYKDTIMVIAIHPNGIVGFKGNEKQLKEHIKENNK